MRVRTFVGILTALAIVVTASYLTNQNIEILQQPFRLSAERIVPVYVVLLTVFLLGFLPVVIALVVQTLKRDLAQRRGRRFSREAKSLEGVVRRGVDLQADGQWGPAATEYEAYLAAYPEHFETLGRYGETLRHLGRGEEALEVHRRASVLYPQSAAILYELAEDYEVLGETDVALQLRDRILREFPSMGLRVMRRQRSAALGAQDWKGAMRLQQRIEALLEEHGGEAELERENGVRLGLAYQQGVEHLEADEVEEARAVFGQILEQEPRFVPAFIMRGEAALMSGDDDEALADWLRGFEATGSPVFLQRIEDHFIERENPLLAIETLHGLIADSRSDLLPRFFLGRLYYRLEMHEEALKVLAGLEERIRKSPTFHYLLARIRERRGEMHKAVDSYRSFVRESGLRSAEYSCGLCRTSYEIWQARCAVCGSWNSVELDFAEESVSADELGARKVPMWAVYDQDEK
ncbi:MAG: tetratricopeptide repeat protein [Thermoanaerobaculia bacterium]